jgi:TrmH family RNA methyltransferase
MITIKKLKTLKTGTLRRKTAVILQSFEDTLLQGQAVDLKYLSEISAVIVDAFQDSESIAQRAGVFGNSLHSLDAGILLRELNGLRHEILKYLGTEPADWDFRSSGSSPVSGNNPGRTDAEIYLDDIRSPFNMGSIFRTAEAFGVKRILLSPDCPDPGHPRAGRSSMGCTELVDWERVSPEELFGNAAVANRPVFALELGGTPVSEFSFPRNGIAVIGSEELGISPESRTAAEKSAGLVSIPVYGLKGSINVSVAFGIMMQRWSESLF